MSNERKSRRLTAIDLFILFAVVAVIASAGIKIYGDSKVNNENKNIVVDEYIVSFECKQIKEATAKLIEKGDVFHIADGKYEFGIIEENPAITPAKLRVELANGEIRDDVYSEKNGDNTLVDITGEFRVKGYKNSDGLTFIKDGMYIAPNVQVTAYTDRMSLSFTVTDIEKVS